MAKILPFRRRASGSWDSDMRKPGESIAEARTRQHRERLASPCTPPTSHDEVTWEWYESVTSDKDKGE